MHSQLSCPHTVLVTCHPQNQGCDQGTDHPLPRGSCCSHGHCTWQGRAELRGPSDSGNLTPTPSPTRLPRTAELYPGTIEFGASSTLQLGQGGRTERERERGLHPRPEPDSRHLSLPVPRPGLTCARPPGRGWGACSQLSRRLLRPAPSCRRLSLGFGHPAWVITTHCSLGRIPG